MAAKTAPSAGHEFCVLFVGPEGWWTRIERVVDRVGGIRSETVRTGEQVRERLSSDEPVDCIVSASRLPDMTGTDFAGDSLVRDSGCPFVLAPSFAEDVSTTGPDMEDVTWVVPLDDDGVGTTGIDGLATVLSRERECHDRRRRITGFDAAFNDPDRFVAVLGTDGTIHSLNQAATNFLDASDETFVGKRFWALPWRDERTTRRAVQRAVRRAADGAYAEFEGALSTRKGEHPAGNEPSLECRIQPATGENSDELFVQGRVLAEREQLEDELRTSEELHRVTLNNMTDTVLITNDEGEFTYVCPNVHFIFGYTAEEIHAFGTIDELLGDDLVDPDRLASRGVLTNIECTATDKSDDEHTLLVNVRTVSIQGGTKLYSCRDITKRKQRERALAQLQQTSRDLLYAETRAEVATQVAEDAITALTSGGVAIYHLDGDENVLYPMARSEPFRDVLGSLPEVSLDQDTAVSRAFVQEETTRADAVEPRRSGHPFTGLSDFVAIPLSRYGVLLAATVNNEELAGVNQEVAELLAATTEAAFDRLEREGELRERDEKLQRQNQRLSEVNQVNEIIREIDQALVHAETRSEIEKAVCERLSESGRFTFAWIGEVTAHNRRLLPREWAGTNDGYLDTVSLVTTDEGPNTEPSLQTVRDRSITFVSNVANQLREAEWCKEAVSRNFNSVLSIPLVYDDVLYGTLTVYDDEPNSFSETVQAVFGEFGDTIGAAINSIQRKEALRSDAVYRVAYRIHDSSSILVRLAELLDCTLEVKSEVLRADDTTLVFVTVDDAEAATVVSEATTLVDVVDGEVIQERDRGGLVGLEIRNPFVTSILANYGATRRTLEATPDGVHLVIDVPDSATIRAVDEMLSGRFSEVELLSQQKQTRPTESPEETNSLLTDRQEEVAQVAYHSGFFDPNRTITGRDVAKTLDISDTAFYDHIRRIERKLFASLFEHRPGYITVE